MSGPATTECDTVSTPVAQTRSSGPQTHRPSKAKFQALRQAVNRVPTRMKRILSATLSRLGNLGGEPLLGNLDGFSRFPGDVTTGGIATESNDGVTGVLEILDAEPLVDQSAVPQTFPQNAAVAAAIAPVSSVASQPLDRRSAPRRASGCIATIIILTDGESKSPEQLDWLFHSSPIRGRLVDLSVTGLLIAVELPIADATPIAMRITSRTHGGSVECRGIVLRTVPDDADRWHIVCQLQQHLNLEQIHLIGRHLFSSDRV